MKTSYTLSIFLAPLLLVAIFVVFPLIRGGEQPRSVSSLNEKNRNPSDSAITTDTQLVWQKPRFKERIAERKTMVKTQMSGFYRDEIRDKKVLEAMRQVPRHCFVTDSMQKNAYDDNPLPIGYGQTISQPYIVAFMTEALNIEPGDKILEIGTGSGYQAAVLSELTPNVYTIEIIKPLAEKTSEKIFRLGYKTIKCKRGDGYYGWEEFAPFDGIIVTAAAGHIPPPLVKQMAPGGRMIVPVGGPYEVQNLVVLTKSEKGELKTKSLIPVRFVPMTGKAQKGED